MNSKVIAQTRIARVQLRCNHLSSSVDINEIGADLVNPPSETRQTSRPVSASTARQTPPDAQTSIPRLLKADHRNRLRTVLYTSIGRPVAATSAMTWLIADFF